MVIGIYPNNRVFILNRDHRNKLIISQYPTVFIAYYNVSTLKVISLVSVGPSSVYVNKHSNGCYMRYSIEHEIK